MRVNPISCRYLRTYHTRPYTRTFLLFLPEHFICNCYVKMSDQVEGENLNGFFSSVPPSAGSVMVIDGYSPPPSVIRRLSFQSHHFKLSIHSFLSTLFSVFPRFLFPDDFMSIICLRACSSDSFLTCRNHFYRLSVTFSEIFATTPRMYSFFFLSFHLNILI